MATTVEDASQQTHRLHPLRYVALLILFIIAVIVVIFARGVAQRVDNTPTTTPQQQSTEQTTPGANQNIGAPNQNNTTSSASDASGVAQP